MRANVMEKYLSKEEMKEKVHGIVKDFVDDISLFTIYTNRFGKSGYGFSVVPVVKGQGHTFTKDLWECGQYAFLYEEESVIFLTEIAVVDKMMKELEAISEDAVSEEVLAMVKEISYYFLRNYDIDLAESKYVLCFCHLEAHENVRNIIVHARCI